MIKCPMWMHLNTCVREVTTLLRQPTNKPDDIVGYFGCLESVLTTTRVFNSINIGDLNHFKKIVEVKKKWMKT